MEELFKGVEARGLKVPKAIGAGFDIPRFKLEEEVAKLEKFLSDIANLKDKPIRAGSLSKNPYR